ncbi:MAG: DUF4395 family protein [Sporichthyaceae bacterium]
MDPFDLLWNHGLRHVIASPAVPPNPLPRRHAFELATFWLLAVGILGAAGYVTAAMVLGLTMIVVCTLVTVTNFCIPSTLLGAWWRWREPARADLRDTTETWRSIR